MEFIHDKPYMWKCTITCTESSKYVEGLNTSVKDTFGFVSMVWHNTCKWILPFHIEEKSASLSLWACAHV
jgi:hypothetical protein